MAIGNVRDLLESRVSHALNAAGAPDAPGVVRVAGKPEFGDYQANGIMGAAKRLKTNPRELAARVVDELDLSSIADVEIAGPGFLNLKLKDSWLASSLNDRTSLLVSATTPQIVVVDYSSPNLAKEMHVGHIRSTIIGDATARMLEALGHQVVRQNHVGDWGTQFGMLVSYLRELDDTDDAAQAALADLEEFYRAAKATFDADAEFAERSRLAVVALQAGDPEVRGLWQRFIELSLNHCQALYERLGTTLRPEHVMAESAYNDALPGVIESLRERGLLAESEGAQCVFLDEFKGKDGDVLPVIVQKSDGGYLYATTDLAAVAHRSNTLNADRVMVFTDARQVLHFRQIYAVAKAAGFDSDKVSLEHYPFGAMLGNDGKPFKTREGSVVKLSDLLDEALERGRTAVSKAAQLTDPDEINAAAQAIGVGAVKYADLSKNRTSDYVFDWDAMMSFEGNTAPYLQYAYARIQSIFARGDVSATEAANLQIDSLTEPAEHQLAATILRIQEVVEQSVADGMPHFLCTYLYELSSRFMTFYEACPILKSTGTQRQSRLALAAQTANVLRGGLDMLGIETVDRM